MQTLALLIGIPVFGAALAILFYILVSGLVGLARSL